MATVATKEAQLATQTFMSSDDSVLPENGQNSQQTAMVYYDKQIHLETHPGKC